jgi:hypothetical protein
MFDNDLEPYGPEAPTGVVVVRGSVEMPADLVYTGIDAEGQHVYEVANVSYRPGDRVQYDDLPEKTSIVFKCPNGVGNVG